MKHVKLLPGDFYQIIIAGLRYAYTRNNGAEPQGMYDHVYEYLPEVLSTNRAWAMTIARQAAEECISDELTFRFPGNVDNLYGDRKASIEFVEYLVNFLLENGEKLPYNYDKFLELK